jgi:hypothetical protein
MLLEGRAYRRIGRIVGGNIGKPDAAQFRAKSRTQRHDVHRRASLCRFVGRYGKSVGAATIADDLNSILTRERGRSAKPFQLT